MRVLMVTPSYFPIIGGGEVILRSLSKKLMEMGIHTDILTYNMDQKWKPRWKAKMEKIDGIDVYKIPAFKDKTYSWNISKSIKRL